MSRRRFQGQYKFLRFFLCQIASSNFGVDRRFLQRARTQFYIRLRKKFLNFPTKYSFVTLTFLHIYSREVVQLLLKMPEHELILWGKKCDSVTDKLHAPIYNFTAKCSSHMKMISGFLICIL